MLSEHENKLLCETGPGTPMGELFRRFYIPALLAEELPEPDCTPVAVRLLGEDLVAFRDSSGRVGLVDAYCAHRCANLFWGRNEENGIRCTYHGWKYDVTGQCVDMPAEPPEHKFQERVRLTAYPTKEYGGCIWAYMGPKELEPPDVPFVEWVRLPPSHYVMTKRLQESNWAQATEGGVDGSHVTYLHSSAERIPDNFGPDRKQVVSRYRLPDQTFLKTTLYGYVTANRNERPDGTADWSLTPFLLPSGKLIRRPATNRGTIGSHFWIPVDDHNCWDFCVSFNPDRPLTEEERARLEGGSETIPNNIHALVEKDQPRWDLHLSNSYQSKANIRNNYFIDRENQKTTSFTGIRGFSEQDFSIQESMGRIARRQNEHLGVTDQRIIEFRRVMLGLARDLLEGKEPEAPQHPEAYAVREANFNLAKDVTLDELLESEYWKSPVAAPWAPVEAAGS